MIVVCDSDKWGVLVHRERHFNPSFSALKAGLCLPFLFFSFLLVVCVCCLKPTSRYAAN